MKPDSVTPQLQRLDIEFDLHKSRAATPAPLGACNNAFWTESDHDASKDQQLVMSFAARITEIALGGYVDHEGYADCSCTELLVW